MNKILITILLVLAITFSACGSNVPQEQTQQPIKIGILSPSTGALASLGTATMNAVKLAEADIKAEYGEDAIEIIFEDTQANPTNAVTGATKLINIDNVDAIFAEFTGVSLSTSPVAKEANKSFFYSAFTKEVLDENPIATKMFMNYDDACEQFLRDNPGEKVLILDQLHSLGLSCLEGLQKVDLTITEDDVEFIDADGDYRTILMKAKEDYDRIVVIGYEAGSMNIIKQMVELGIEIPLFCTKDNCATDKILEEMGEQMPETIYFLQKINPAYIQKYKATYGEDSADSNIIYSSAGYDVVKTIFKASLNCENNDATCITNAVNSVVSDSDSAVPHTFENNALVMELDFFKVSGGEVTSLN